MKEALKLSRILRETEKVKRIPRRPRQPLRDFPTYTIPQAAVYLALPERTLRYWVSDNPVWPVAGSEYSIPLMSFRDLAQAYYIEIVRKHFGLSLSMTRTVLEEAKKESRARYPLLRENIRVFFKHILMVKDAHGHQPKRVVDLTQHRQLAIGPIVEPFMTRIRWDTEGQPIRLFPWRIWEPGDQRQPVSIDPNIMSGGLVINGTRIPVEAVLKRQSAGETVPDLAKDYDLPTSSIQEALRHLVPQAA